MNIIISDDAFAAFFIDAPYAAIKYHSEKDCPDCEHMLPVFHRLENAQEYNHIKFGLMNADINPAAKTLIASRKLPFVAVYKNSLLAEGGTVTTETQLREMLDNLPNAKIIL